LKISLSGSKDSEEYDCGKLSLKNISKVGEFKNRGGYSKMNPGCPKFFEFAPREK